MTHYVLLKFQKGYLDLGKIKDIEECFEKILKEESGVHNVEIKQNYGARENHMDIMIRLDLANEDALQSYLQNQHHLSIARAMNPFIIDRAVFEEKE